MSRPTPTTRALLDIADALSCPQCSAAMTVTDRAVRCASGHAFDIARQGYAPLPPLSADDLLAVLPPLPVPRPAGAREP